MNGALYFGNIIAEVCVHCICMTSTVLYYVYFLQKCEILVQLPVDASGKCTPPTNFGLDIEP